MVILWGWVFLLSEVPLYASQGQILLFAFRQKFLTPFKLSPLRSKAEERYQASNIYLEL